MTGPTGALGVRRAAAHRYVPNDPVVLEATKTTVRREVANFIAEQTGQVIPLAAVPVEVHDVDPERGMVRYVIAYYDFSPTLARR